MLTRAQIEELRPLIANEIEGSPARLLLAHLDEQHAADEKAARKEAFAVCKRRGHTDAEAELLVSAWLAGQPCETEEVKCWECEGWGFVQRPGCMGSASDQCQICLGRRKAWRYKMPAPVPA